MNGMMGLFSDIFENLYGGASDALRKQGGGYDIKGPPQEGQTGDMGVGGGPPQSQIDATLAGMMQGGGGGGGALPGGPAAYGMSAYRQAPDASTIVTPTQSLMQMALQKEEQDPYADFVAGQGNPYLMSLFGGI